MDVGPDCERITAPTLIVTGERGLDHVVPVDGSTAYVTRIRNAHAVVLERTGHLGTITRPEAFTDVVREFMAGSIQQPSLTLAAGRPDRVA
jgi:pimeloyl-ACP methyl ester carboxylesterase